VVTHELEASDGDRREALVLEPADWVNVVALDSARASRQEARVVLVRQWRFGVEQFTLEIPGGAVDTGEEPLDAARRELAEETGYHARSWQPLGVVEPNPAIQSNRCSTWLATDLERRGPGSGVDGEEIEVVSLCLPDVETAIANGEIRHALVVAAFQLLRLSRWYPKP
jgi:8-oxo-dGTP pyrophosphatase MutT (NUDIX family)